MKSPVNVIGGYNGQIRYWTAKLEAAPDAGTIKSITLKLLVLHAKLQNYKRQHGIKL